MDNLGPDDLGPDFPILFIPLKTSRLTRPLFRVPDESLIFLFDILSTTPDAETADAMVTRNRELFEAARDEGSKKYVISAIPFSRRDWVEHYRPVWNDIVNAKRQFDPDNVLTPGPGIF